MALHYNCYSKTAANGVKLHWIETTAPYIYLVNLENDGEGQLVSLSGHIGMNASYFVPKVFTLENIAIQNGKKLGKNNTGGANITGSGVLYYYNGQLVSRVGITENPDSAILNATWAQGGFSMFFGDHDWEKKMQNEKNMIVGGENLMTEAAARTAMVGNISTKEIRLIITGDTVTVPKFRAAITSLLGIGDSQTPWAGLMLDGGHSAQMYANTGFDIMPSLFLTTKVPQMVAVKP